jgi:hypothetical protein
MDQVKKEDLFNLECCVNNLYKTSLSYYGLLKDKKHPYIKHITDIMDLLINYKKTEKERNYEENVKVYDEIHKVAYKNIEEIFDYDKKIDEENGIKTQPQKLEVGFKQIEEEEYIKND